MNKEYNHDHYVPYCYYYVKYVNVSKEWLSFSSKEHEYSTKNYLSLFNYLLDSNIFLVRIGFYSGKDFAFPSFGIQQAQIGEIK